MPESSDGPPTYSAECRPDYLRFTCKLNEGGKITARVRDIDARQLVADGVNDEVLIAWATFQTLVGIESLLKGIEGHLAELVRISQAATQAAARPMPDIRGLAAIVGRELGLKFPPGPEPG